MLGVNLLQVKKDSKCNFRNEIFPEKLTKSDA
jgi:hypothetical protein